MSEVLKVTDLGVLEDLISTNGRVVVKFTAPSWCGPCRQFAPVYEAVSDLVPEVLFVSVDIDEVPDAPAEYNFRGVPSVMYFEDGVFTRDLRERTAIRFKNELSAEV